MGKTIRDRINDVVGILEDYLQSNEEDQQAGLTEGIYDQESTYDVLGMIEDERRKIELLQKAMNEKYYVLYGGGATSAYENDPENYTAIIYEGYALCEYDAFTPIGTILADAEGWEESMILTEEQAKKLSDGLYKFEHAQGMTKGKFYMDSFPEGVFYEGFYNKDEFWNGWRSPYFTKEVMEKIVADGHIDCIDEDGGRFFLTDEGSDDRQFIDPEVHGFDHGLTSETLYNPHSLVWMEEKDGND